MNTLARLKLLCRTISILLLVFSAAPLAHSQQRAAGENVIPLIQMDQVPVLDAIKNLARQAGINYIVDPRVEAHLGNAGGSQAKNVSVRWQNVTAFEALERVLTNANATLIQNPATTVARIAPRTLNVKPVNPELVGTGTNTIPLIVMSEVPLADAIQNLARQAGIPVTLDPVVSSPVEGPHGKFVPTVNIRWEHLTAKQALVAIADNYDLVMKPDPATSTTRIEPK